MNIAILTTGTRGDTQPYIALALELRKSGHRVRIAASEAFEGFITQYDLDFHPTRGDVTKIAASAAASKARGADNPLKFFLSLNDKTLRALLVAVMEDLFRACHGADVIVYHPGAAIGYFAAQHLKIPSILASPFPMGVTKDYPALLFYDTLRLGPGFNYATHKLFQQGFWLAVRSPIREFWKQEFGHGPENLACPFGKQTTKQLPTVMSCSKHVFPTTGLPEHVHQTGYWFLDDEPDWAPSAELVAFLEAGPPPVYVGFGSLSDVGTAKSTTELVLAALQQSGQRGVLATGWNGMETVAGVQDGVFVLDSAPHAWLFPRMAAVVHHGGAGTTAAGFRAGVPTIVIPHANDQFAWGRRAWELGVGPQPIPRRKLTPDKLAAAIQSALTEPVQAAAHALGTKIQGENGAQTAAQIICDRLKFQA